MLLSALVPGLCSAAFLLQSRPARLGMVPHTDTTHRGLDPPASISNQENALTDVPTVQSDGGKSLIEGSSSQVPQVDNRD